MAALTGTIIARESLGSLTLIIVNLTTTGSSDTYTIEAGAPVIRTWCDGNSLTSGLSVGCDSYYTSSTGVITLNGATGGSVDLFILMKT